MNMEPIDAALKECHSTDRPVIAKIARKYGIHRTTLTNRFNGKSVSREEYKLESRLLDVHQEKKLIQFISRQSKLSVPPTPAIVANVASQMAGRAVGKNYVSRFVDRYRDKLDSRYLDNLDLARHKSESRPSFERYFEDVERLKERYNITLENTYNMDEKGFMIGQMQKSRRIFAKDTNEDKSLIKSGQDGKREWITVLATICADDTVLSPYLIYKAKSGLVQDSWLEGFETQKHNCHFGATPNGWTSHEHGMAWLDGLFNKETKDEAGRSWRLLFVDGHGSHINQTFIDRCETLRILLVYHPPHSTHKLQPLDVGCFRPLAQNYSKGLGDFIFKTAGITSFTKSDFFPIFWQAWQSSFNKRNISSAWKKAGLNPWDPDEVLKTLKKPPPAPAPQQGNGKRKSMSFLDDLHSPRKAKKLRTEVRQISKDKGTKSAKICGTLYNAWLEADAKASALQHSVSQLGEAINQLKKQRSRTKGGAEQLRAEEGRGHVPKVVQSS